MGPIDIWASNAEGRNASLSNVIIWWKNIIEVDNVRRVQMADSNQPRSPFVTEDIEPANLAKGIDGTSFKVKFNKREFGHGDIVCSDK